MESSEPQTEKEQKQEEKQAKEQKQEQKPEPEKKQEQDKEQEKVQNPNPETDFFKKRKLASVQKITSLSPLDQKNLYQKATILGWNVIVDNNVYSVGEKVIYFEADALLPPKKKWTKGIKPKNLRIKTK